MLRKVSQALTSPKKGVKMAEADHRLPQGITPAQARSMRLALMALAQGAATQAVKRQFQGQGLRPQYMAHRVIVAAADEYLPDHPELIAEAKETVLRWHAEGMFGKRGGIRNPRRQRAKIGSAIKETSSI